MATMMPERLIVFTRFPEPGKTKTRLIPALGEMGAADLQRRMTEHIIAIAAKSNNRPDLTIEVRYEGGDADSMRTWLGPQLVYRAQGSGNLGRRMVRAFEDAFQASKGAAVVVGSDIPGVSTAIIRQAFEGLQKNDLVIGPAHDGGYYLIGMKSNLPADSYTRLFDSIRWGTRNVLSDTLQRVEESGLRFFLLEPLADVDRPEDLHIWHQINNSALNPAKAYRISIIIPALNETATIGRTLSHLEGVDDLEVIVVDGGSNDGTAELAETQGAKVIQSQPGKAVQMNAGAAAASGDILAFLHADTLLPEGFSGQIISALNQKGVVAGAFRLSIDSTAAGIRIIERVANYRSRLLRLPYGDQALFIKKSLFEKMGGFAEVPIMEDFILVRRLNRKGKIVILPTAVTTSPRRWMHYGIVKTWFINQAIIIAYYLGITPERLTRWYRREESKGCH